ncbi:Phosphogluconate dehydrogenase, NAD-binding protein [Pseudonocardia dioxanivorans CB1190]|uniref:Phosphogluconate dehydrogenase, NAD-binding protein n=1 Tax=Pseudonocardia dioxanivorans (strain ATCC 55486 / DSM 44775 / JCM 13855 / CB1190) TaxID=675635 RepID=F4CT28_PSEUX|nr:Phosphogluconate dehydrogenase, NAD-binding protein [Pseudonocardia dioxanivorans CB1190]
MGDDAGVSDVAVPGDGTVLPARPVIGILHPGAMGAALGSALKPVASGVVWAAAGRSQATSKRAELADLIGVPDLAELARRSHLVVSICPPHAALDVARQVAAAVEGRPDPPLYVDANAVSPATVEKIGELLGRERVVDGAVIGPPAWEAGRSVLWLSGEHAQPVADLFAGSPFATGVLDGGLGAASALKACFALRTKALPTIWATMAAAAHRYGVLDDLRGEVARTGGDLDAELSALRGRAGDRAWRWAGEMDEAGDAVAAAGLPDGFSRAAAEVYRRLADGSLEL